MNLRHLTFFQLEAPLPADTAANPRAPRRPSSGSTARGLRPNLRFMDTVLDRAWTAETFVAWEDRQARKHEFDGRTIIPMTGGSVAHQDIVFNVRGVLGRLLAGQA